ncbi:MAG: phenylalanine--tRNA ligase subunit alpha [Acidimicrobiales bacterium]
MPTEPQSTGVRTAEAAALPFTSGELGEIEAEARAAIEGSANLAALEVAERLSLGKRSRHALLYQQLGRIDPEARKVAGQQLHQLRRRIEDLADARRSDLELQERTARMKSDQLDLTEVLRGPMAGHLHLVTQVREQLEDVFVGMGYEIAEGPEVETDWYNFQALNVSPDHPARSSVDTFFLDTGAVDNATATGDASGSGGLVHQESEETFLLRTHTSPVQIHLLERGTLPIYAVVPGRVYRRDTPDATHLPVFHQLEGLVVDRGVTFGDLAGTIDTFVHAIFGGAVSTRLRPAYFPFTEPSAEFEISCQICEGTGCRTCSMTGWIELGGSGMVHPAVLEATGVDPEQWSGFAFGFGIDRLAIMRHGIADMRAFVENDVRFLRQF